MAVIFVRTRHVYQSYTDFWRLVAASSFETRYIDEIDLDDDRAIYIFTPMNGEIVPKLSKTRRAKVIWWHLERPGIDPTTGPSLDELAGLIDDVWVSDRWAVTFDGRFTYALMASERSIASTWARDEKIAHFDVAPLAYLWGRRHTCVSELVARGMRVAPAAWGQAEQDDVLSSTAIVLNLHQYLDSPMVAPLRFAVAAAYAVPIVSEFVQFPQLGPYAETTIDRIADLLETLLADRGRLATAGAMLFDRFCEQTDFRREVEKRVGL